MGAAMRAMSGLNIGLVGLNPANIQAYQAAIKGLTAEQAAYVLASKGASAAQIEEIMSTETATLAKNAYTQADIQAALAKQGLATTTTLLTAEQQAEIVNSGLLTSEKLAEVAAVLGLETAENGALVSKQALNAAMVQQQLASIGVVGSQQTQIMSMLGLTAVEEGNIAVTNVLTAAWTKLVAVISAHPIGALLTAVGAVAVGVVAYISHESKKAQEAIIEAHETAKSALDSSKNELSSTQGDLQSLESQLASINDEIASIAKKPNITLVDKNQLDRLSASKRLLEEQQNILENNLKIQEKAAATDAKELLGTQYEGDYYTPYGDSYEVHKKKESYNYAKTAKYQASELDNSYKIYINSIKSGDAKKQQQAKEAIDLQSASIATFTSELYDIAKSFQRSDGTIVEGYEDIYNEYMGYINNLQSLTDPEMFYSLLEDASKDHKDIDLTAEYEKLLNKTYTGEFDIESVNKDFINALAEHGITEETINRIFSLKQAEYSAIISKIDNRYNPDNVLKPTYLRSADYVPTEEDKKQEEADTKEYEAQKKRTKEIHDTLADYAKKNPVEFQLLTAYDEDFTKLDSYINEELETIDDVEQATTNAINRIMSETSEATAQVAMDITSALESTKAFTEGVANIQSILNEQTTGKSLSAEAFNSAELSEYTSALEYHNGALQLNKEKVNELIKAQAEEKIQINATSKAMEQTKYLENAARIEELRAKIKNKTFAEDESEETIQNTINKLLEENGVLKQNCDTYDLMTNSIREATSAYQNFMNAQNAAQSGDMFDGALEALKKINDTLNVSDSDSYGRIGNEDYKAAIDFVIPDTVDADDQDAVNSYLDSVKSMFTLDSDGNFTGLNIAEFCSQAVEEGLMVIDEQSDEYKIAGQKTMQDFADGLNLSLPLVQAMFGEMEEFGGEFDWADEADKTLGDLAVTATESAEALRSMKDYSDLDIKLNVDDIGDKQAAIDTLDATIKEMNGVKANVDVDSSAAEHANNIIRYCVEQKQLLSDPIIMSVDTSMVGEKIGSAISLLQELQTAANNLELNKTLGIDTADAQAQVDSLVEKVQSADNANIMSTLQVDTSDYDSIMSSLQTTVTGQVLIDCGVDDSAIIGFQEAEHNSKGTVEWSNDTAAVDTYISSQKQATGKVQWYNDESLVKKTFTATGTINWTNSDGGKSKLNGSAHAGGTAKANGDWRTQTGGQTLVGELGQEIVVDPRTGKWYTVGDNGAEFRDIPKGSIVFNHLQSKSLLENGYVTGRGSSLASGSAMVTGGIKIPKPKKPDKEKGNNNTKSDDTKTDSTKDTSSTDKGDKEDKKEDKILEKFKEWISKLFDWIEIKLERQAKKIDRYVTKADNAKEAGSYDTAAKNYRSAITSTATQISYEQTANKKYNAQADKVLKRAVKDGVISEKTAKGIAKKVKNGTMNIAEYSERMREVIKDYQTWFDKAENAKDAITELHNNIRTYIADLKALRDAQRDAKLDSIKEYTSIGTSGVANSTRAKNSQLSYTNSQLLQQNAAYDTEVSKVTSDANAIGKKGTSSVKKALKSKDAKKNKKYKKALKNAQKAIKAKKPVASADLKVIKSKSIAVYNNLYAYNLALDNIETAKLEQAANYAATSAETYKNIAESYDNKDKATSDKISLLKQKSANAKSASKKNSYLEQMAKQYDTILKNDDAEIAEYNKAVNSNRNTITKKAGTTTKYKKSDSKTKKAVKKVIQAAKAAVKSKKPISASTISSLAKYYTKGYVTKNFYEACIDYNNALESLDLAKEQKELDVQEAIAEKAAIGSEMVNNVEQEYINKLNNNENKTRQIQTAQSLKTTRGLSLTSSDYNSLIAQSQQDQALYSQAATAISQQIQSNLANGYWTANSQEYKDAIQTMNDYSAKAEECRVEQEEWNNAIAEIPYSNLQKVLDLLDAVKDNYESMLSIRDAMGLTETESEYLVEIANANNQIAKYTEMRTQAWNDYQKALANSDGVYGGKTADEWLAEYYKFDTSINNLNKDVVELNNSIANIPYETIEKALDLLKSVQSYNSSSIDLKSALGLDLSEADYMQQIQDNNNQIEQISKERLQAYADYLKALSNPDGVYGGKTASEWLTAYNEYGASINDLTAANEKLKDSLRDDVYWRAFERAHSAAQRFQSVLSGLSDLIDSEMYFDNDGNLTEYGVAQVANLVSEYENARQEVQNYQADIANLNRLYADGQYTQEEYVEKLNELQNGLLDSASSMKQFSDSIVDMYKNMAQSELDSLMKLIDARNDALSAKKAYYDYDKTIKDRTKDIQTLEAEIAALQGVETAEAKAKRAMYEAQLADSQKELDDTIQQHMFDLSQDALNELKITLQDAFDDKWEEISSNLTELTSLMAAANQLTASSAGTIVSTMNKLLGHYGIDPVSSGIQAAYASGTRRVPKNLTALTNENGNEILVTKQGMITPLEQGDGVVPSYLTDRLYDLALNGVPMPNIAVPEINIPENQTHATEVNQHYDSLINIEGSADAATVEDLKALSKDIMEKSYAYTSQKIYSGYMHSGGKRNV